MSFLIQTILSALESHQVMPNGSRAVPPVRILTFPKEMLLDLVLIIDGFIL